MIEIIELTPGIVWKHFSNISHIPRPSGNEERIREYIRKFAETLGLETRVDRVGNVLVSKNAFIGLEKKKSICIQCHMDMVSQKNKDVIHDFDEDPVEVYVDGEWVTARGTTLGADNGIGMAAALAVLESTDIPHGPIEVLFTVDEETGFTGAFGLEPGFIKSEILINLDSEFSGQLFIGSAGGRSTTALFQYNEEPVPQNSAAYEIRLKGMRGGHSGLDIHMGWGNSIKILARFLCHATKSWNIRVSSIEAGSYMSAIPCEAFALVTVPGEKLTGFIKGVKDFEEAVKNELSSSEPDVSFDAVAESLPQRVIDKDVIDSIIHAICNCPNGVIRMSEPDGSLVDTSSNLGILKAEEGIIKVVTFQRSFDKRYMSELGAKIGRIFDWAGATEVKHKTMFPIWVPDWESSLLKEMQEIYRSLFKKEAEVKVIHAGLECGVFKSVYPDLEMISIGPSIYFAHSPEERVNIESVEEFWKFLKESLVRIG